MFSPKFLDFLCLSLGMNIVKTKLKFKLCRFFISAKALRRLVSKWLIGVSFRRPLVNVIGKCDFSCFLGIFLAENLFGKSFSWVSDYFKPNVSLVHTLIVPKVVVCHSPENSIEVAIRILTLCHISISSWEWNTVSKTSAEFHVFIRRTQFWSKLSRHIATPKLMRLFWSCQ